MKKRPEKYLWDVTFSAGLMSHQTLTFVTRSDDPQSACVVWDRWLEDSEYKPKEDHIQVQQVTFQGEIVN